MTKRVITVIGILITVYPIGHVLYDVYINRNAGRSPNSARMFDAPHKSSTQNVNSQPATPSSTTTSESSIHGTLLPSEQLQKIDSSGKRPKENPVKQPVKQPAFQKQIVRDTSVYIYCFSTIQRFGLANQGIFHIYKKDDNTFWIKCMLSSSPYPFPEEGMLLSMDKSSNPYIDQELGMLILKRNIKEEIATWLKSD